jgi:hypothetical protein
MSEKKTYRIPVVWTMMGYIEVEAENADDACHDVMLENHKLPKGEYLDDSFGIDMEGVKDKLNEEGFDVGDLPEEYWK